MRPPGFLEIAITLAFNKEYVIFSMCFMSMCCLIHYFHEIKEELSIQREILLAASIQEIGGLILAYFALLVLLFIYWLPLHLLGSLGGLPVLYALFRFVFYQAGFLA